MAEEAQNKSHEYQTSTVETKDRGLFDFLSKKEEEKPKPQEEVMVAEFEQVHVSESEPCKIDEDKKPSLLEKLHRSDSSSSSSSDEEEGEGKEKKKKKKKGLKEKVSGDKKEDKCEDTTVPIEKYEEEPVAVVVQPEPEEKKGFLEKIKEKLPGQHKKAEETPLSPPPPPPAAVECVPAEEGEAKEKKGILEKIKEKLPGYHPKSSSTSEEDKVKEKD